MRWKRIQYVPEGFYLVLAQLARLCCGKRSYQVVMHDLKRNHVEALGIGPFGALGFKVQS